MWKKKKKSEESHITERRSRGLSKKRGKKTRKGRDADARGGEEKKKKRRVERSLKEVLKSVRSEGRFPPCTRKVSLDDRRTSEGKTDKI